mmetsp:Transcript_95200/g.211626  ORF Transcript_95200/g.211626 Transcript_95200/m.211626 type:complete len:441 (+) Transcript_95200:119-1441(+)
MAGAGAVPPAGPSLQAVTATSSWMGSLDHSLSVALTEISHLSAFNASSRNATSRPSRCNSHLATPRPEEIAVAGAPTGPPNIASTIGEGTPGGRRPPRRRPEAAMSEGSSAIGTAAGDRGGSAPPLMQPGSSSSAPTAPAEGVRPRRRPSRALSGSSARQRSRSQDSWFDDDFDVPSCTGESGALSTLAGTTTSTLSTLMFEESPSSEAAGSCGIARASASRPGRAEPRPGRRATSASPRGRHAGTEAEVDALGSRTGCGRQREEDLLDAFVRASAGSAPSTPWRSSSSCRGPVGAPSAPSSPLPQAARASPPLGAIDSMVAGGLSHRGTSRSIAHRGPFCSSPVQDGPLQCGHKSHGDALDMELMRASNGLSRMESRCATGVVGTSPVPSIATDGCKTERGSGTERLSERLRQVPTPVGRRSQRSVFQGNGRAICNSPR